MSLRRSILVVDDEANIRDAVKRALERSGYNVETAEDAETALVKLEHSPAEIVLCDVRLPGMDGIELLGKIKELHPDTAVVMITAYASIEAAVNAIKLGAADYVPKPFDPQQLRHVVAQTLHQKLLADENRSLKRQLLSHVGAPTVIAQSPGMQQTMEVARRVAAVDSGVLITGESGTGKEVIARFIHAESARAGHPFVTVNCAAIPANLLESELFGHRRGAFTGAHYNHRGNFEVADEGTLFLDEIGEMPLEMQAKILRALEERKVQRVGSEEPIDVDVRIVAATNQDLASATKAGRFREDLYWRLNVVHVRVPALRERREDILPLARHFLEFYSREQKKAVTGFSEEVQQALARYGWPGNVRELRNAVERAIIFAEADAPVRLGHLPAHFRGEVAEAGRAEAGHLPTLREVEERHIREVLGFCAGNRKMAAEILGVSPVTLWRRLGIKDKSDPDADE